jgi:predicted nucleic acid-binding protein
VSEFPERILVDTNIFILGFLEPDAPEADLLSLLETKSQVTLIFSNDLEIQIRRVGRRLRNSDWVGLLLHYIWSSFQIEYVYITPQEIADVEAITDIPREDLGIYLTALRGKAEYLISANRELLRTAVTK